MAQLKEFGYHRRSRRSRCRRVWEHFGQRLSDDVLLFYITVGTFAEYEFDVEFFWSLWPWEYLIEWNSEDSTTGIQFCDHSMKIVNWELRFEDQQHSSVWSFRPEYGPGFGLVNYNPDKVAPDLETFLHMYLEDPWQLM